MVRALVRVGRDQRLDERAGVDSRALDQCGAARRAPPGFPRGLRLAGWSGRTVWAALFALVFSCLTTTINLLATPSPASAASPPPAAGANLLANADFTGGVSNWSASPGTTLATFSASGLPVGTTYLQVKRGSAAVPNIAQDVPANVIAGQSYQGSIWVRAATGTVRGTLALWGLGITNAGAATYFTVGTRWTQINVAFNPTGNHTSLQLQVYLTSPNPYDFLDAQITPQMLSNSDFTEGFSRWSASPGSVTAAFSASGLPVGTTYLQVKRGSAAVPNIAQDVPANVIAGQSYQGSFWVRAATGTVRGTLALWGLGITNAGAATYFTVGTRWTQINVAFNPTGNHTSLQLQVYLTSPNPYDFLDAQITPQMLSNSDFTEGFSRWSASPGSVTAAFSASGLPVGTTYLQVKRGSAAVPNIAQDVPANVIAGQSYQGSFWVRAATGTVRGTLALWGLGITNAGAATYFTVGTRWTQINVAFNPTGNHTSLQLQVYLTSPNPYDFLDAALSESPPPLTGTGPYGFEDFQDATTALNELWPGIGSVSGFCTAPSSAYSCATGADANMAAALNDHDSNDFWLSFWTIGAPLNGASWYTDGFTAGQNAARELIGSGRQPTFEILDPEGFGGAPASNVTWAQFASGWSAGLLSISGAMHPGLYADQFLISTYGLLSLSVPIFVAVSPILGNTPQISGAGVHGYIAFYAACPAGSYINQMTGWGASFNTLQFQDSAVDCAP